MVRAAVIRMLFAVLTSAMIVLVQAPLPAYAQANFDRIGGDYLRAPVRSGDPADCAMVQRDRRCRAWTFSYPRRRRVLLAKDTVPQRTHSDCCVSGVRGAGVLEPRGRGMETSTDRSGGDYRSFEIKGGGGEERCKTTCDNENKCRAWTYARPGYAGRDAAAS